MLKHSFTTYLLAVFLLATATPTIAQQSIHGQVVDQQTQQPLPGANILYNSNRGTTTSAGGNFRIPCEVPVQIKVSYIGYETVNKTITDCNRQILVQLVPLSYSLQNITVTGETGRVQVRKATPVATLGLSELNDQTGLRLREALNTIPGVEMGTRTPFGGQRIIIRGYYPNVGMNINFNGMGYQLFFNNIPITGANGVTIMDAVDFANLGRVKVIKGPSVFYGNEIAGAVNLYSQRPQQMGTTISEQVIAGRNGLFRNNTALMMKNEKMNMTLSYGRQSYDGFRPHSSSQKDYISFLGDFTVSDKQQIHAYFSYNHSSEQLAGNIGSKEFYANKAVPNPDYVNNDGGVLIKGIRLGVTSVHIFNVHFSNKSTVFVTSGTRNQRFAHGSFFYNGSNYGARTNFTFQQQLQGVGINAQLGAFMQYSVGAQNGVFIPPSVSPPFNPQTKPQFPTDNQTYAFNYNLFTKWDFELPLGFKISAGLLVNFNKFGIQNMLHDGSLYNGYSFKTNTFDPTFNPSFSILKTFSQKYSLYARVTTGDSPPLLGSIIQGDGSVNTGLKPEHAVQYEVGSKGRLFDDKLSYKLALFDLEIDDRLVTMYKDGVSYTTNVGKQLNRGIEFFLGYDVIRDMSAPVTNLKVQASYTYSHFRYDKFKFFDSSNSVTANYSGNVVAGVPDHMFNLGVDLDTRSGFYLSAGFKYRSEIPVTFNNDKYLKSYTLVNGKIGYKHNLGEHFNVNLFVGSNNLTGSTYYNLIFVGKDVKDLGDGYISPAPYEPGYYGQVSLKYNF